MMYIYLTINESSLLQSVWSRHDRYCIHWFRQDDGLCLTDPHVLSGTRETSSVCSQWRSIRPCHLSFGLLFINSLVLSWMISAMCSANLPRCSLTLWRRLLPYGYQYSY